MFRMSFVAEMHEGVLSYPMKKLLCESIVYCDFLLIILLIVGLLIEMKAFVCLFVCLFVYITSESMKYQNMGKPNSVNIITRTENI
jgi:uncharacterized membrane protein YphA (DoxX/SURF4 family)